MFEKYIYSKWSAAFESCYIISIITALRPLKCNIVIILQT